MIGIVTEDELDDAEEKLDGEDLDDSDEEEEGSNNNSKSNDTEEEDIQAEYIKIYLFISIEKIMSEDEKKDKKEKTLSLKVSTVPSKSTIGSRSRGSSRYKDRNDKIWQQSRFVF